MSFYSYKNANAEQARARWAATYDGPQQARLHPGEERLRLLPLPGTTRRQEDRHLQHRARAARRLPRQLRRQLQLLLRGQRVQLHLQRLRRLHHPRAGRGKRRKQPLPPAHALRHLDVESCRSSTTKGRITNLCVERLCDRPQFARVKAPWTCPSTCSLPTRDVRNGSARPCCRWTATCFCASRTTPSSPSPSRA